MAFSRYMECDGDCGHFRDYGYSHDVNTEEMLEDAQNAGWFISNRIHLCPECKSNKQLLRTLQETHGGCKTSLSIALIRFNDGTILRGVYQDRSDTISPYLICEEEIEKKYDGDFWKWAEEKISLMENEHVSLSLDVQEDVAIFTNYSLGYVWKGKASKEHLLLTEGNEANALPYEEQIYYDLSDDIPEWVVEFYKKKGWNYEDLLRL